MSETETSHSGHRQRLRQRLVDSGGLGLSEAELLELMLTYAIPRQDVAPLAHQLLDRFGSLAGVLAASFDELTSVAGIGEQAAVLVMVASQLTGKTPTQARPPVPAGQQLPLFKVEPSQAPLFDLSEETEEVSMGVFANDETSNALRFLPEAERFKTYEEFRTHLRENLPYNSVSTRQRRANYILARFFPDERLDTPLAYYAARCASPEDLKPAVFYHTLKAVPIAAKVAEELIWPALPIGQVEREGIREFVMRYLPNIGKASQAKVLHALFNTYHSLSVAVADDTILRFQVHQGTTEGFLYVLAAEFPEPGMYSFDSMEQGPMRHWLLWDREWMRQQLYNLRDLGIIPKISEIDTVRQFTLQFDQWTTLRSYFEHPDRNRAAP